MAVPGPLHIDAGPGDIAPLVLLPGDPLRARVLAQGLLGDVRQVAGRRGMLGFTGTWRGQRVSIMGSGMGIPSCAIYATELARFFGVRRIVRVGTCAGVGDCALGDVLVAQSASTDSRFNRQHFGGNDLSVCADFLLLRDLVDGAAAGWPGGSLPRLAPVFSTDAFHGSDPGLAGLLRRHRILGVEMESAGLYGVAMREGFAAAAVLMVSDLLEGGEVMDPSRRETGMDFIGRWVLDSLLGSPAG